MKILTMNKDSKKKIITGKNKNYDIMAALLV